MLQHQEENWLNWVDELSQEDYVVIDDFIDERLYRQLLSYLHLHWSEFKKAGIGTLVDYTVEDEIRGDFTYWLDRSRDDSLLRWWSLVDEGIAMLKRYCFLSLGGYEFHLAHYPQGSHYDRHVDQFNDRSNRVISMVTYLNEEWKPGDGGELKIYKQDGTFETVEPVAKRCVMFKSAEVPHEVLKANKSRFSLTGWLLYQPASLGQFLG